ncbi:MAG: formate--tetrahydrofolate ligase [Phycisphaeraceae bacterium]|nr:formate--tetrahydrofolate ligase [Phycisphaeraceae bacterium]
MPADIDIALAAELLPIGQIAQRCGIDNADLEPYGKNKAKVTLDAYHRLDDAPTGKLILVSAITPTPAGIGKTTTTIGLTDALNRIGKNAIACIREPSMGPCFGMKGGAAGGGYSQVVPMEDINLHFTGDFHAIGLANNLLAAMLDNHIHQGNALGIDPRRISWRRVVDMNDRALRHITVGLGGVTNSMPREDAFDITVASEVMAIFCLVESLEELRDRLGRIVVAQTWDRQPVTADELNAAGAMTALLRDAIKPNLVQTLEHNPAIVHGGPFANIAHGCNSVLATKLAMRLGEYTVTEAGFGADLGAEKFLNIKCRKAGISPNAVVIVATVGALKMHGGVALDELGEPDPGAVEHGVANLEKHVANIHKFRLPAIVAINRFEGDTDDEIAVIHDKCDYLGVKLIDCDHWSRGGAGAENLAKAVVDAAESHKHDFRFLYPDDMPLWNKVRTIAKEIYGADDVLDDKRLRAKFRSFESAGYGHLPICIAKTPASLSTDPGLKGRPQHFDVPLRDARLCAGAGFIIALAGDIMTMPGLPKRPAAENIDVDGDGNVVGLF